MTTVTMRLALRDKAGREHMTRAMADPGADNGLPASLDIPSSWGGRQRVMPGSGNLPSTALTAARRPGNLRRSGEDPVELVVDGRDRAVGPFWVDQRLHH